MFVNKEKEEVKEEVVKAPLEININVEEEEKLSIPEDNVGEIIEQTKNDQKSIMLSTQDFGT